MIRALGWLLLVLGPGLSIAMAALWFWLSGVIRQDHLAGSTEHWRGGPEFTHLVFGLFGSIFVFGLITTAAGVYQVSQSRRSPWLIAAMLLAAGSMVYFGYNIMHSAPR